MSARQVKPDEPDTSIRAELSGQIASAQAQLEGLIAELQRAALSGGDTASLAQAEGQIRRLENLQRRLEHAGPDALATIRNEVAASIAATELTTRAAATSSATAQNAEIALHAASAAAHRTVSDLADEVFGKKKYDAYLQFASAEDEEAYRKRTEDRERYIKDQLALGTSQGNLNAAHAMQDQLKDAKAHGADAHPDFANDQGKLALVEDKLLSAMAAASPKQAETESKGFASLESRADAPASPELDMVAAQLRAAGVVGTPASTKGHGAPVQIVDGGSIRSV